MLNPLSFFARQQTLLQHSYPIHDYSCPDCGHEHIPGGDRCGHYLGEGKFCECPSRRAA